MPKNYFKEPSERYIVIGLLVTIILLLSAIMADHYSDIISVLEEACEWLIWLNWSSVLQTIWTLWSFLIAVVAYRIASIYNLHSIIQNKLAFEEFRPNLIPEPSGAKIKLTNQGNFEAAKFVIYSKWIGKTNEWNGEKTEKDTLRRDTFLFSPSSNIDIVVPATADYSSYILLYTNYSSGITYFRGFNFRTWSKTINNIWDTVEDINWTLLSPIAQEDFQWFIDIASIREQIENPKRVTYEKLEAHLDKLLNIKIAS